MATKQKLEERKFYRAWHRPDRLETGVKLEMERSVEFVTWDVDRSNLADLVKLPLKELQSRRKGADGTEKAILKKLQAIAQEWEDQAAQTMLLDRAIEYVRTPEVQHTGNEWKRQKGGFWEISNRVYQMRYSIEQIKDGPKKGQWLVTWGIRINRPPRPSTEKHYYTGEDMVVEIKKKYYNAEADAQHYIQGRFDVYARLFTELSPPIPHEFERHFHINGVLLPGYTVSPPERSIEEVSKELLGFLRDCDLPEETPPQAPQKSKSTNKEPPPSVKAKSKSANRKQPTHKKKSLPAR